VEEALALLKVNPLSILFSEKGSSGEDFYALCVEAGHPARVLALVQQRITIRVTLLD